MSSEEETFKRLRRTPYSEVERAILSSDDFYTVNFFLNNLTHEDKTYIASQLPAHGWDYHDFMNIFEHEASEHLRRAAQKFKDRMDKIKK